MAQNMKIILRAHQFFKSLTRIEEFDDIKPWEKKEKGEPFDPKEFFSKLNFPIKVEYSLVNEEGEQTKCGWDGTTQTLFAPKESDIMSLYHDLAHYLIADPRRLSMDDFGLGQGYQSVGLKCEDTLSRDYVYTGLFESEQIEEEVACYLSLCMAKDMRVPRRVIASEMKNVTMTENLCDKEQLSLYVDLLRSKEAQEQIKSRGIEMLFPRSYT